MTLSSASPRVPNSPRSPPGDTLTDCVDGFVHRGFWYHIGDTWWGVGPGSVSQRGGSGASVYHMYHTEMVSLRLPTTVLEALDRKRGSTARGRYIRHLIEQDVKGHMTTEAKVEIAAIQEQAVKPVSTNVGGNTSSSRKATDLTPPPSGPAPGAHRHKRGRQLSTRMVKGSRISVWACADPACSYEIEG